MSTPVVLLCTTYVDDVSLLLENSKKQEGDYKEGSGVGSMTVGRMKVFLRAPFLRRG